MELQVIFNAIDRIEADLKLIKQELAGQSAPKKQRKLSQKQLIHDEAMRTLADLEVRDRLKAKKLFSKEIEEIAALKDKLLELQNKNI